MFNTNKETAIEVLQTLMGMLINPLMLQMGIVSQQEVYHLLTDFIKLVQQDPTRYLVQPQQGPPTLQLTADEVIQLILMGRMPSDGVVPREEPQAHMQRILDIAGTPEMQDLSEGQKSIINIYLTRVQAKMAEAQQQQQLLQHAQQFQQSIGGGGQPGPAPSGPMPNPGVSGNPQLNSGELLDEALPGAR